MHKQDRTNREVDLENIMEAMYSEKSATSEGIAGAIAGGALGNAILPGIGGALAGGYLGHKTQKAANAGSKDSNKKVIPKGKICTHCNGTGKHADKDCVKCKGTGEIVVKEGEGDSLASKAASLLNPFDAPKRLKGLVKGSKKQACPKCGKVHTINAGCGNPHSEGIDDWNDQMHDEEQSVGYIQIDLHTGGVQTISPDEVEQATHGLEHIPSGQGVSDWDAWRGEEYMIVAVPKTVHWPQTAAYQH